MPPDFDRIAAEFAADRARRAALVAQAQAWTGGQGTDELGSFDVTAALPGDQVPNIYARLAALSVQRLRVLSAQLAEQYADRKLEALVYTRRAYNPATEELEAVGEEPTALAVLEGKERDRLERLLTTAVRLQLEVRSAAATRLQGLRIAGLARAVCEEAGLDWADPGTRRVAQRAVARVEAQVTGGSAG